MCIHGCCAKRGERGVEEVGELFHQGFVVERHCMVIGKPIDRHTNNVVLSYKNIDYYYCKSTVKPYRLKFVFFVT